MSVSQKRSKRKSPRVATAAMPSSVDPMLPTPIKLPFSDPQWLFEPKWDGYRARSKHWLKVKTSSGLAEMQKRIENRC